MEVHGLIGDCYMGLQHVHTSSFRSVSPRVGAVASRRSGHFHFGSLVQCPDEIGHNSAGIPAVPFKEPLPAYSPPEHVTVIGQYYLKN
jgi:hypothetical protein